MGAHETGRELWRTEIGPDYAGPGIRIHVDEHEVIALGRGELRALSRASSARELTR